MGDAHRDETSGHGGVAPPSRRRAGVPIGRLFGVEVRLHWTFLALLALLVAVYWHDGAHAVVGELLWVLAVFGSVLLHESAHCIVARRRGAVVDDILLTPIAGLSQMHDVPEAAADEAAISVVGPLTNLVLAVVAMGVGLGTGVRLWPPTLFAGAWAARLLWLNVLLGGFNLVPAIPMDGGWLLRSLFERHQDKRTATMMAARVSRILAVVMIVAGLFYDLWLALIGVLVFVLAGGQEQAAVSGPGGGATGQGEGKGQGGPGGGASGQGERGPGDVRPGQDAGGPGAGGPGTGASDTRTPS